MYGVIGRRAALVAAACAAAVFCGAFGAAGRAAQTAAAKRELPIYSVEVQEKKAALGINCAWDDSDIGELLQLLEDRDIRATFFIVGDWCDKYPDAVRAISAAGHELGSHSDTHPDMTKLGREEIAAQLDASKRKIEAASGRPVHLFRAPSGAYNDLVVSTARALGWEVVQWSNEVRHSVWVRPPGPAAAV